MPSQSNFWDRLIAGATVPEPVQQRVMRSAPSNLEQRDLRRSLALDASPKDDAERDALERVKKSLRGAANIAKFEEDMLVRLSLIRVMTMLGTSKGANTQKPSEWLRQ